MPAPHTPPFAETGHPLLDRFVQALLATLTARKDVKDTLGSDMTGDAEQDAALDRFTTATQQYEAARAALLPTLTAIGEATTGAATTSDAATAPATRPARGPEHPLLTAAQVEAWQHSTACLAHADRTQCICGLTALQAFVRTFGRRPFEISASARTR